MTESEQELIRQTLDGHTEAFSRLVERYQDRLYNSMLRATASPDDASEFAQEAFVLAFRRLDTFRGQSAFYSWLFRIAMNVLISHKRKRKRRPAVSLDAIRDGSGLEPTDRHRESSPSHQMEKAEDLELVRQALDAVTEEFRIALVMKEIEGLKYEEIAEMLEIPIGTVRSRIHRARAELREKLRILTGDHLSE